MFDSNVSRHRASFLEAVAAGAAAGALSAIRARVAKEEAAHLTDRDFRKWLDSIEGTYRQVCDMPETNGGMGLMWASIMRMTGAQVYGVGEKEIGVVVVLRHNAVPIALNDSVWREYRLGDAFKINDPATNAPATRNPFCNIKPGDLPLPEAALDRLIAKGVKVAVCNMALTHYSSMVAKQMGRSADQVSKDWLAAVIPGVAVVASGVLAVSGAQSKGCAYCFAG